MNIGRIVKTIRECDEHGGMSQMDLAKKSGVCVKALSQIETGKREPTIEELFKISKALDNDLVWELTTLYD